MDNELVFAFDVGTGSLGLAARRGMEMIEAHTLLLDEEYGKRDELRKIIRAYRTRKAHQARHEYLDNLCRDVGIPVLEGRKGGQKGDPRLEREFPRKGDPTQYNSYLLRIMLLRGEKLEPWQVYKALHSAIQRRGFDPQVPWKNRASQKKEDDEDSQTAKKTVDYENRLRQAVGDNQKHHYPCYYAALQMGLWDPVTDKIKNRIDHMAKGVRNEVIPRALVARELSALIEAAARQFPALKGRALSLIYGPSGEAYASYFPENRQKLGIKEGSEEDWKSLLGQKIPRFDNRSPANCALIPRFHVARSADIAVYEATFLMKLKNMRFYRTDEAGLILRESSLSPKEIGALLKNAREEADEIRKEAGPKDAIENIAKAYSLTKTDWKNWLKNCADKLPATAPLPETLFQPALSNFEGKEKTPKKASVGKEENRPLPSNPLVEAPSVSGRSRYSRPAARLIRALVLSGESGEDFYKKNSGLCGQPGTLFEKLRIEDLDFLKLIKGPWENIYIPTMPLSGDWNSTTVRAEELDEKIEKLIGAQRNVLVAHRIGLFNEQLRRMIKTHGKPDQIAIEFIRDDFMGEEAKKKLNKIQNDNRSAWEHTRQQAAENNIQGGGNIRKLRLLREQDFKQDFKCPYTGETLSLSEIDELEIEHIVPRARGGSDNRCNTVVTRSATNREKGDRTPYEWLSQNGTFKEYCERVDGMKGLSKKKKMLLTAEDPLKLDEKWDSLAETAYIARLARDVAALRCGWQPGEAGERKLVQVINGALTARVRAINNLNSLLADREDQLDPEKMMKKVRKNKRHHALDAMVLSFIPEWARNPKLKKNYNLPPGIDREYFNKCVEQVVPYKCILTKSALQETFYGTRLLPDESGKIQEIVVTRLKISELGVSQNKFDQKNAKKEAKNILDPVLRAPIAEALENQSFDKEGWAAWCNNFRHPKSGAQILKVRARAQKGDKSEYVNVAKEGEAKGFRGQYKTAKQHQGYFIYLKKDKKGIEKPAVWPVYAWQSFKKEEEKLKAKNCHVVDFFQAGCLIEILCDYEHGEIIVQPGKYILRNIKKSGWFKLDRVQGVLPLSKIENIRENFRRVRKYP
ncbi:MAG: hypothetical protein M0Q48_09165 [Verrucomicrobia bacterium]|nr:hypothetical protein [Verrucomicrobiota bacterium]